MADAGGAMVMVLWAPPPAGSGDRRKKREEIGRDNLVLLVITFYEITLNTFYAHPGTIEGDQHIKDIVSWTVRITTPF